MKLLIRLEVLLMCLSIIKIDIQYYIETSQIAQEEFSYMAYRRETNLPLVVEDKIQDVLLDILFRLTITPFKPELCSQYSSDCTVFVEEPLGISLKTLEKSNKVEFIPYNFFELGKAFPDKGITSILKFTEIRLLQDKMEVFVSFFSFNSESRTLSYFGGVKFMYDFDRNKKRFLFRKLERIRF